MSIKCNPNFNQDFSDGALAFSLGIKWPTMRSADFRRGYETAKANKAKRQGGLS